MSDNLDRLYIDTPVRVALLGYGYVGKTFHIPLIQATPGFELRVIASSKREELNVILPSVRVIDDAFDAIHQPDIELVVIATPNATHAPLAKAALEAGKHVVIDKPFTLDLSEARELIALAEKQQRLLSVFHNRRWDSDYLGIKDAIKQGAVGEVVHFESHFDRFRPEVRVRWREQNIPGSGLWFDLGPHLIDQALQLFGLPDKVRADIATLRPGGQANDWAHVILEYPTKRVLLHGSMLVAGGVPRFVVHGNKGSLVKWKADQQEAQLIAGVTPGSECWGEDQDDFLFYDASAENPVHISAPRGDQRGYYVGVHQALRHGKPNPVAAHEALAVMAILETAVLSAQQGVALPVQLTEEELRVWQ